MNNNYYRPEIDGLRALAVLTIIIFHAGVESLSGGFIGVDVFYVISGFLITQILTTSLIKKNFSYQNFYARRIKRLLPAAFFTIISTLILATLIMSPMKLYELAKSAVAANLFVANVWFMNNSGYFDTSTQIAPLVHMWSLAIEEQFYFIYPFILVLAHRINGLAGIKIIAILLFIIPLSLSIALSTTAPNFSFYMLPTRAWELALGALISLYKPKSIPATTAKSLPIIGFTLLIYGLVILSHTDIYPGYLALIPTVATAMILFSTPYQDSFIKQGLSSRPLVFVGKISYSAYLWHWPIIVFYRIYINERAFNVTEVATLIIISLIAGYFSWRFIEERFRYSPISNKETFKKAGYVTLLSLALCATILLTKGLPFRVPVEVSAFSDKKQMRHFDCTNRIKFIAALEDKFCIIGNDWETAKTKAIIWGDSHSQHWAKVIASVAKPLGLAVAVMPKKCPAYINSAYIKSMYPKYPTFTEDCTVRNKLTEAWLQQQNDIDLVILAAAWSAQTRMIYNEEYPHPSLASGGNTDDKTGAKLTIMSLNKLLPKLRKHKVLLLADIPRPNKNLNECAFSEQSNLLRQKCPDSDYKYLDSQQIFSWHNHTNQALLTVAAQYDNTEILIPSDHLCDDHTCKTYINGELIYRDNNHIRRNIKEETALQLAKGIGLYEYFQQFR